MHSWISGFINQRFLSVNSVIPDHRVITDFSVDLCESSVELCEILKCYTEGHRGFKEFHGGKLNSKGKGIRAKGKVVKSVRLHIPLFVIPIFDIQITFRYLTLSKWLIQNQYFKILTGGNFSFSLNMLKK